MNQHIKTLFSGICLSLLAIASLSAQNDSRSNHRFGAGVRIGVPLWDIGHNPYPESMRPGIGAGVLAFYDFREKVRLEIGANYDLRKLRLGPTWFYGEYEPVYLHHLSAQTFTVPILLDIRLFQVQQARLWLGLGAAWYKVLNARTRVTGPGGFDQEVSAWYQPLSPNGVVFSNFWEPLVRVKVDLKPLRNDHLRFFIAASGTIPLPLTQRIGNTYIHPEGSDVAMYGPLDIRPVHNFFALRVGANFM